MLKRLVYIQLCLIAFFLTSCQESVKDKPDLITFCTLEQVGDASCDHSVSHGSIGFYSSDLQMTEETELVLEVKTPKGWRLNRGLVSGHSMYMGEIPVVWTQKQPDLWQAKFSLPACTGHEMIWKMDMKVNTHEGLEDFPIYFSSKSAPE